MWRWLHPGMRVKRWFLTMGAGIALLAVGAYLALGLSLAVIFRSLSQSLLRSTGVELADYAGILGAIFILTGVLLVLFAVQRIVRSIAEVLMPDRQEGLSEIVYRQRALAQGHRIVVIGGGTGLATMLRGLKRYSSNLTAIVTVADDGGSSGRLTREYNVLPPGDIRNCIVALADNEGLMSQLFQYRFDGKGEGLSGHSFGNLFLLAMTSITGNFDQAIREMSRVLAIRGRVLPSTLSQICLVGHMTDGSVVRGETHIVEHGRSHPIHHLATDPEDVPALREAVDAILNADLVIVGPGSLYTSIIPNLLIPDIRNALRRTTAQRLYVCNVMTQPGETDGFTAPDHVRCMEQHAGEGLLDIVLVNTRKPGDEARDRYAAQGAHLVPAELDQLKDMGYRAVAMDLMNETNLVRHDPEKLANAILEILM